MNKKTIVAILMLNLVDLVSTIASIEIGLAEELNPLMAYAYSVSPALFVLLKVFLVGFGLWIGWKNRQLRLVRRALLWILFVYIGLMGWHASMWFLLIKG